MCLFFVVILLYWFTRKNDVVPENLMSFCRNTRSLTQWSAAVSRFINKRSLIFKEREEKSIFKYSLSSSKIYYDSLYSLPQNMTLFQRHYSGFPVL